MSMAVVLESETEMLSSSRGGIGTHESSPTTSLGSKRSHDHERGLYPENKVKERVIVPPLNLINVTTCVKEETGEKQCAPMALQSPPCLRSVRNE